MKSCPFSSPLWNHVDLYHLEVIRKLGFRAMRSGHRTWLEIARCLEQEHGLKTSHKTVHGFFKRVVSREKLPMRWAETEHRSAASDGYWRQKRTNPGSITNTAQEEKHCGHFQ